MNPPPPPPHGEVPKSSGLPPGKYDIFIIPPHSSGSGFLYLPSLKPNVNSFAAGFASALILVVIANALAPAVQAWWNSVKGSGGMGMIMLMFGIAVGAWALGRTQSDGGPGPGGGSSGGSGPNPDANGQSGAQSRGHSHTNSNGYANGHAGGPTPHQPGPQPGAPPHSAPPPGNSYNAPPPPPPPSNPGPTPNPGFSTPPPKPTWQRTAPPPGASATGASPKPATPSSASKGAWEKAREETKKREEERKAKEAERKRKEELEKRLKELREKEAREREAREKKQKEEEEREKARQKARDRLKELEKEREAEKEKAKKLAEEAASKPPPSTYAFSSVGERINPWPKGRPPSPSPAPKPRPPPSPKKPPPPPTAKTYKGTDEDAYSYRPYDKPKKPMHNKAPSSIYSESSYAASHTTSQTTPPPSQRGPYSTKDPDKIVIKAVYAFNNAFLKTPTSQLVSGVGSVTDGLILRITTEGLFIDDDVRGVPQREWDVKTWTMKLVETGEFKSARLHLLRASIRDQEGRKFVFVITEEESWKVAVGLQRLRKGPQVRALGVSSMSTNDARSTLESLGWV